MALNPARSGLARSGNTRSGYPIQQGVRALLYALSGVARSGATRSNYHSPSAFVTIGGVHYGAAAGTIPIISNSAIVFPPGTLVTTAVPHGLVGGELILISDMSGGTPSLNGQQTVFTITSATTFRLALTVSVGGTGGSFTRVPPVAPTAFLLGPADLVISDLLNEEPNRAEFTAYGFRPTAGLEVIVTLGSKNNLDRQFAGVILQAAQSVLTGHYTNDQVRCNAIDYTWELDRLVTGQYTGSYTDIARSLMTTYAPWCTTLGITAGLPTIEGGITFTLVPLKNALTQLAKRGGYSWVLDYHRDLAFGASVAGSTAPTLLNTVHVSMNHLSVNRDLSQVLTRVYVVAGGAPCLQDIAIGETLIPVLAWQWFQSLGGVVLCGPQRITYNGLVLGGGGGLVGPGASPSGAPALALATGSGIESGAHGYALTFTTAAGESIAGPTASITVGVTAPPTTGPTAADPTIGTGPNPGTHLYAVTFGTASGETTAGPSTTKATTLTPAPTGTPTVGAPTVGAGVDDGTHDYAVTFGTSIGETTPGPISLSVVAGPVVAPGTAPTVAAVPGTGVTSGAHFYGVTFANSAGETPSSPVSASVTTGAVANAAAPVVTGNGPSHNCGDLDIGDTYDYAVAYSLGASAGTHSQETEITAGATTTAQVCLDSGTKSSQIDLSIPYSSHPAVLWVQLYRRNRTDDGGDLNDYRLLQSFANDAGGSVFSYSDGATDASIAGNYVPVASNTALVNQVSLINIPIGGATVTSRKLYRTAAGGAQLKLLATISNNSATTYVDTIADGSLGADVPVTNTAKVNVIGLSAIPLGDANVTSRKLYRRSGGLGLKLLATIADNTTRTYSDSTANASLGAAVPSVSTAYLQRIALSDIPLGDALVTSRKLYRTVAGGATLKLLATLADNVTTTFNDTVTDASLGADAPSTNTATANRVNLSGIPIGSSTVTSRKLYRTVAGGAQLKLLATLADNVTTTYADLIADASLGANVPVADASGLAQVDGVVLAGSTTLIVAGTSGFRAAGGWAVIGNGEQVIRYTGITGSSLTGIPASGVGSIAASIGYNSTATQAPMLTGIPASGAGAILESILKGDEVNQFIQVDSLPAQAVVAALLTTATRVHDGVLETVIEDRRLGYAEAVARGEALLALRSAVRVDVRYTCRDLNTRAGRTVSINIAHPWNLTADFLIQSVTISGFSPPLTPARHALRTVEASSERFAFEDILRMLKG